MNSQCTSEYINDSYTDAKICLFQMILGTPVVLTHTTHTHIPVRLSLHFADTGAVMRRVAYKTKQNFPLQGKKILFDKIPLFSNFTCNDQRKNAFPPKLRMI